jgi:ketosteroid isomerase-like protein
MNAEVKRLFEDYAQANTDFQVAKIASLYADVFMFGGPQGARAVKKDDFVKMLPRRKEFFKSVGLTSSTLAGVEVSELDSKYTLVTAAWKMRIERSGKEPAEIEVSSTYLLYKSDNSLEIVFQIDHQDLATRIAGLG